MFGWLANMLVSTPVQGSGCGCCASKKEELEKMQQALERGTMEEKAEILPSTFSSGSFRAHCSGNGEDSSSEYYVNAKREADECSGNCGHGGRNCDGKGGCGCGGHGC